jgi:protein disulfide-isomerase A6
MKPAWDQLSEEFAASSSVVIGDVDCTVETDLCSDYGVSGYPTIKYFTPETDEKGDAYNGGRDFDALKSHVTENLEVKCDVEAPDGCSEKETKYIEKMKAKGADDIKKQLDRLEGMKGSKMAKEQKTWMFQRLNILTQLNK